MAGRYAPNLQQSDAQRPRREHAANPAIRVSNKATIGESELVLSIIPRIVRNMPYMNLYDIENPSGTEAVPKACPEPMLRMAMVASCAPRIDETSGSMFVALSRSVQLGAKP